MRVQLLRGNDTIIKRDSSENRCCCVAHTCARGDSVYYYYNVYTKVAYIFMSVLLFY